LPAARDAARGWDLRERRSKEKANMRTARRALSLMAGALLFALVVFMIAAAPGFLSDQSSNVPVIAVN